MTRMVELLRRKRDGERLTGDEISAFVADVTRGAVPDYQISAFLMAIFFRGLDREELVALTHAMLRSGDRLDFSDLASPKVDKHSTGGVGDKVSIALAPAVAACGVFVPMIAGRGLGHTGGTLDKLESIPGLRTQLDSAQFAAVLRENGLVFGGQSARLAPADRILYALRDATATVESIPLIVSSILSKKLAEGIDGLVLDVKVGKGAFMKTLAQARELGRTLVEIGQAAGTRTHALLTDMEEPLGCAIGNLCEVVEAVDVLRGKGPPDTRALTIALGAEMLVCAGRASEAADGARQIEATLQDGSAYERFRQTVAAQGGDPAFLDERPRYAPVETTVLAPSGGYIEELDAEILGDVVRASGGGRGRKEDTIDPSVGVILHCKRGARVAKGEPVATLWTRRHDEQIARRLERAIRVQESAPDPRALILERIAGEAQALA